MGVSQKVFKVTGGYADMRFGEDIDLSTRIMKAGFKTDLVEDAFVYHKRRTSFKQFFKQVYNSGIARINLYKLHPETLKLVHLLPAAFLCGTIVLLSLSFFSSYFLVPLILFVLIVLVDSFFYYKNVTVSILSVFASLIQMFAYGSGFLAAFWKRGLIQSRRV